MDFRMGRGGIRKIVQILLFASVVDQNDVGKAVFQQAVNHGGELFIRVKGRQDDGDFRQILHRIRLSMYMPAGSGHGWS